LNKNLTLTKYCLFQLVKLSISLFQHQNIIIPKFVD